MRAEALLTAALLLLATQARAGTRPGYGGAATIAVAGPLEVLDPALAVTPQDRLYTSLVHQPPLGRDAAGALYPVLLKNVPQPEGGGVTFRLELRPGLQFHDGTPVEPEDLAASLRRLGDPLLHSPSAVLLLPVSSIEVLGPTVVVHLLFPFPAWPSALAEPATSVLPRSPPDGLAPPGAGPFRLAGRTADGGARLVAFEGHGQGRPFLDQVLLVPAPRPARLLEEGKVDLAQGAGVPLLELTRTDEVIALAPGRLPLAASLEAALDRQGLARWLAPEGAQPLEGLLPGFPGFTARASAGVRGAHLTLLYDPGLPGRRAVAERVQLRLHEKGVEIRLLPTPSGELAAHMASGFDLALLSVPVPRDAAMAAAAPLLAAGDAARARELLSRVGAAGPDPDAQRQAVRAAAGLLEGAPLVPLLWSHGALGSARVPSLSGLATGKQAADLAWAFREGR